MVTSLSLSLLCVTGEVFAYISKAGWGRGRRGAISSHTENICSSLLMLVLCSKADNYLSSLRPMVGAYYSLLG